MTTRKIASALSEQGRIALAQFLAENLSDKALRGLLSAWEQDVTFDINDNQAGYLEIGQHYSRTKNPVVKTFYDDDVVFEEIEEDDE